MSVVCISRRWAWSCSLAFRHPVSRPHSVGSIQVAVLRLVSCLGYRSDARLKLEYMPDFVLNIVKNNSYTLEKYRSEHAVNRCCHTGYGSIARNILLKKCGRSKLMGELCKRNISSLRLSCPSLPRGFHVYTCLIIVPRPSAPAIPPSFSLRDLPISCGTHSFHNDGNNLFNGRWGCN